MRFITICSVIFIAFTFSGCKNNPKIDTDSIQISQNFLRFEQDLFRIPTDSIWDYVPLMEKKYPTFFELFNQAIINIGASTNFDYDDKLANFLTDPDILETYNITQKLFSDLAFKSIVSESFKRFNFYFPERQIPNIYTHISGFNQSLIIDSSYISISLDKYLGSNSKYYQMLRTSMFQRQNMHPEKIPSDVMMAFLITEFPNESTKKNLISEMIYYGKIHYALDVMLPNEADTLKWGFTDKKLKWCNKNERFMWTYLIEHKQIFSSSLKDIIRYNEDGPFTTPFTKESPARTGRWIGYQIVNEYMKQNKHLTLQQLLAERDHQKILNESKYKP